MQLISCAGGGGSSTLLGKGGRVKHLTDNNVFMSCGWLASCADLPDTVSDFSFVLAPRELQHLHTLPVDVCYNSQAIPKPPQIRKLENNRGKEQILVYTDSFLSLVHTLQFPKIVNALISFSLRFLCT